MKNLIEILKNVPEGTKLYSTIHGDIYFDHIDATNIYPIKCYGDISRFHFTKDGKHYHNYDGECVLFPSKEQRDWSKFELPCQFKLGDVLTSNDGFYITIFNKKDCLPIGGKSNVLYYNCYYDTKFNRLEIGIDYGIGRINEYRYATEIEKNILFGRLQEKGYFWNDKTNSLEKYKFKVGDNIQDKATKQIYTIYNIEHDKYKTCKNIPCYLYAEYQDNYELYQEKFDITTLKPYDKVLTRRSSNSIWIPQLFSCLDSDLKDYCNKFVVVGGCSVKHCIPYEGNEHLAGTTNDCDEFYKNW
jgi:hypothetical protein